MKQQQITVLFVTTLLMFTGIPAFISIGHTAAIASPTVSTHASFSPPVLSDHGQYTMLTVTGASQYQMDPGAPLLPTRIETLIFPLGTRIIDVHVQAGPARTMYLEKHISPAPTPLSLALQSAPIEQRQGAVYDSTNYYPAEWVTYHTGAALIDEEHVTVLSIQITPARYAPAIHELRYVTDVTVEVTYEEPAEPLIHADTYDLLVITPSAFADILQPLIGHKESRDVATKIVTLDDIYSGTYYDVQGRDDAEKIKYFIRDAVENWGVSYVMLVGDPDHLPVRYASVNDGEETRYISDLYYADLYDAAGAFITWDSNDNGRFAEYDDGEIDEVDLYPDVYIGRLACADATEASIVVNKIIDYENQQAFQTAWFKNIIYCGGDTFPGDEDAVDEGEYANQQVIDMMTGYSTTKIWASNGRLRSSANIVAAFREGAGFADFSGHGSPQSWATHPHEREYTWYPIGGFTNNNVYSLNNGGKLPIIILNSCSNSKFSVECFGWAFLANQEGGAIATLGNTALGYGYSGQWVTQGLSGFMEQQSFRSYRDGADTFGELWAATITAYVNAKGGGMGLLDYKSVEEWQPLGDPSLAIAVATEENRAPVKPDAPSGSTSGRRWREYIYTASTTDPDGDAVSYMFDWGDGTTSGWLGPYPSGKAINATHTWDDRGSYEIKVKARDAHGVESAWSDPLPISIPLLFHSDLLWQVLLDRLGDVFTWIFPDIPR